MTTLSLRRFTEYETLKALRPDRLSRLIAPYWEYLSSRGVPRPEDDAAPAEFPYVKLAQTLAEPDSAMPEDLIETLYLIHEMASPTGHEAMIEALNMGAAGIEADENATALDLAIQIWLADPRLLEHLHAEQNLQRPRAFDYFRSERDIPPPFKMPDDDGLKRLEADLDAWFAEQRRGHATRVYGSSRPEGAWFLVRHGDPFKHENAIKDGKSVCLFFRPERFDVIACDAQTGEIRINARTKGERELYRAMFGRHLFGDDHFYGEQSRFTLEPLRRDGPAALECQDVRGLDWVKLKEIQLSWGGPYSEMEILRAGDVFAALAARHAKLSKIPRVTKATFVMKFTDARMPRTATISSLNRAYYKRDDDGGIFEAWMRQRGFIIFGEDSNDAAQIVELS